MPAWDNVALPSAPSTRDYFSPLIDFSTVGNLAKTYYEGAENRRQYDIKRAFEGGLPRDAQGNPDFRAIMETLAQKGGIENIVPLANVDLQRQGLALGQQAARDLAGGGIGPASAPISSAAPATAPPRVSAPTPSAPRYTGGDNGNNTVAAVVSGFLPAELAGPKINETAARLGVDPNAPLSATQVTALQRELAGSPSGSGVQPVAPVDRYGDVQRLAQTSPAANAPGAIVDPTLGGLVPQAFVNRYGATPAAGEYVRWLRGMAVALGSAGQKGAEDAYNKQADAIATALQKASEPTPEQKNAIASGLPNPVELKAHEAQATEVNKAIGTDIADYIKAARPAQQRIQMLNSVGNALKAGEGNITTGPFAETVLKAKQGISSAFGIDLAGVPESEVAQKTGLQLATLAVKEITNRPTQFEFKTAMENNPGLLLSPKGSGFMIDIMKQSARQQIDLAKLAQKKENWGDWQGVVDNYYATHPLISPLTGRPLGVKDVEELQKSAGAQPSAPKSSAPSLSFSTPAALDAAIKAGKVKPGDVVSVPGGTLTIKGAQ